MKRPMLDLATIAALAAMGLQYTGSRYVPAEIPEPARDMIPDDEEQLAALKADDERRMAEMARVQAMQMREREIRKRGEHPVARVSSTRDFLDRHKKRNRKS